MLLILHIYLLIQTVRFINNNNLYLVKLPDLTITFITYTYYFVQVNQIHSKGLTLYKACEVCCAWEKRGKNNNCKIEMEEALFAISKPDDYLRIYALKNENLMKMAVVSWEMEKYNDDMVAKKKQYLFEKP